MVLIILLGLPGSGRKTLMEQIGKNYKADLFYDFVTVDLNKSSDIKVLTMLSDYNLDNIDPQQTKIMLVTLPTVFKKKITSEYNAYLKADMNILYDNNPFKHTDTIIEKLNYCIFSYTYNFDDFKSILNSFLKKKINILDGIQQIFKENGEKELDLSSLTILPTK